MLHDYLHSYSLSIVFVGDFNPVIFQPFWLSSKGLIREAEAKSAEIEIIHNDFVKYKLDWLTIDINKKRFELKTSKEPYFGPLRDLAISIINTVNETTINALGINHIKEFSISSKETYYMIGNKIAPLGNWDSYLNKPTLSHIEILEQERKDGQLGLTRIRIHPSDIRLAITNGITININDHFEFEPSKNSSYAKTILNEKWDMSSEKANNIIEGLWLKINN